MMDCINLNVFVIMTFCYFYSIKLYTTFWSLSLYDLHVPVSRYDEEIGKLEQSIKALDDNTDMVSRRIRLHTCMSHLRFASTRVHKLGLQWNRSTKMLFTLILTRKQHINI